VLEPSPATALASVRFRALAVRHGLDLEPELPDPAPAYVDPEGALHPALTEPLAAMTLHSWPTPAARAALVARALSEPGRCDPSDPADPFVRLARFAARESMEPEVRGALSLVLLRGLLAQQQRSHRPSLPDPEAMLLDPSLDAFRRRRARLSDAPGWRALLDKALAAAQTVGTDRELAFERLVVLSAGRWLPAYAAWVDVIAALGSDETIPADPAARDTLREQLDQVHGALRAISGGASHGAAGVLGDCLEEAFAAEGRFLDLCDARPDGPVQARWMLNQQIRSMRDLNRFTRPRALALHHALRECDALRLAAHLAWRAAAIALWLSDACGDDTVAIEDELVALPDPPHATTLGAGLGRLRGFVLLRRLRRGGGDHGGVDLAQAALRLAPEELAIRITANDLRFAAGDRSAGLLDSLRQEHSRYRSMSAALMGARVADASGDAGRARWFREQLMETAGPPSTSARWLLHATQELRTPARHRSARTSEELLASAPAPDQGAAPLLALLGAEDDVAAAIDDARAALTDALHEAQSRDATRRAVAERGGKVPGWQRVGRRKLPSPGSDGFVAAVADAVSDLRAAAPALRSPPLSSPLRRLFAAVSRAADLPGVSLSSHTHEALATVVPGLLNALATAEESGPVAELVAAATRRVEADSRAPRIAALRDEFAVLRARCRAEAMPDAEARCADVARALAQAPGAADPDAALDAVDDLLGALLTPQEAAPDPASSPLMSLHRDFDRFSLDTLGIRPDALRRAKQLVSLFNDADGQRDRKRLHGDGGETLFELRHRTQHFGGLRVFYRASGPGWEALAAMSKYDNRPQRAAIARILDAFAPADDASLC